MNDYVELLIKRFQIEYRKMDRSGAYGYTQRMFAYNSNRIEGSTLTTNQTASLFETGTINSDGELVRSKDVEEMTGHFLMFNHMLETYQEILSEDLIKSYHYDLKSGVFEDRSNGYAIGEYKKRGNIVGDIITTKPEDVSSEIQKLLQEYHSKSHIDLTELALFHEKYEHIHPFQDGNGRTGRIILFKECLKHHIFPFIIEDEDKAIYYDALRRSHSGNVDALVQLFQIE